MHNDKVLITYSMLNGRLESRESANMTLIAIIVSALFAIYTISPVVTGSSSLPSLVGSLLSLILLAWRPVSELYDSKQYNTLVKLEEAVYG